MWNVVDSPFDFFQKLAQVVVVERQRTDQKGVQDDAAGPDIRPPAVVFLSLVQHKSVNDCQRLISVQPART